MAKTDRQKPSGAAVVLVTFRVYFRVTLVELIWKFGLSMYSDLGWSANFVARVSKVWKIPKQININIIWLFLILRFVFLLHTSFLEIWRTEGKGISTWAQDFYWWMSRCEVKCNFVAKDVMMWWNIFEVLWWVLWEVWRMYQIQSTAVIECRIGCW